MTLQSFRSTAARGFTLIELMIGVALVGVRVALAGPSFRQMIDSQRLKATSAQLGTDVQFARSEAATRQRAVHFTFKPNVAGMSCYSVHTCPAGTCTCPCESAAIPRCPGEIRTVQVPVSSGLRIRTRGSVPGNPAPIGAQIDAATGGMVVLNFNPVGPLSVSNTDLWVEVMSTQATPTPPNLRTVVGVSGRPSVCSPAATVTGYPGC